MSDASDRAARWRRAARRSASPSLACAYWVAKGRRDRLPRARATGSSASPTHHSARPERRRSSRRRWSPRLACWRISSCLSARTGCVRTYSVQQGLDAVPRVAQSLGMKVMLGVWLGRDRQKNEAELAKGIALANRFPETVSALIVGNEVLLRRELPEAVLAEYLQRARQATTVPVTYADVWEFWMEHQALAKHVSFVTIHILPYWEDEPVAIDLAIEHIVMTAEEMRKAFGGKDILIGETGLAERRPNPTRRGREPGQPGSVLPSVQRGRCGARPALQLHRSLRPALEAAHGRRHGRAVGALRQRGPGQVPGHRPGRGGSPGQPRPGRGSRRPAAVRAGGGCAGGCAAGIC